jgi:hypothetical protein
MFDGEADTCWNSDQGSTQSLTIDFEGLVSVESIQIMFQGGFVGQDGIIAIGNDLQSFEEIGAMPFIDDSNDLQTFPTAESKSGRYMRVTFNGSTDFYGRVTIYNMQVIGQRAHS